ncbi:hypothetical protein BB560_003851 [Smittium megazygosporum]|uniref:Nucleoporin Nup133/Nup155-like N-terminal domain-containing protein n=1 Tax=Smittium megazygosporum TaxID=133381 RepID=A0A2T9ZAV8_9FUNG|nr:hypothetical protein BB560_003851 [Smittium megazygosporum]
MNASEVQSEPWLEKGSAMIQEKLNEIENFPKLSDLLQNSSSSDYSKPTVVDWQTISLQKYIQFPESLFSQYDRIFSDEVKFVLVVATVEQIFLLGVGLEQHSNQKPDFFLYSTQYSLSTDNINVDSISCADNGRIFFTGSNGHIYEFEYQDSDGWISKKCSKTCLTNFYISYFVPSFFDIRNKEKISSIAIDNERSILYSLTESSCIEVYYLGKSKTSFDEIYKHKLIYEDALNLSPSFGSEIRGVFKIVSIQIIPKRESCFIHLIAFTSSGSRLYFSTFGRASRINNTIPTKPEKLELVHVRKPNDLTYQNSLIDLGFYDSGVSIMVDTAAEEYDQLISMCPDNLAIQNMVATQGKSNLIEWSSKTRIEGKVWDICSTGDESYRGLSDLNNISIESKKRYTVITNTGVNILYRKHPIDMFLWLIGQQLDISIISSSVIQTFGHSEMCAMCLLVLTSDDALENLFPPSIVKACNLLFFQSGGSPSIKQNILMTSNLVGQSSDPLIVYSGRHDGILKLLARTIYPIWKEKVFVLSGSTSKLSVLDLNISYDQLNKIQLVLMRLNTLISRTISLIPNLSNEVSRQITGATSPENSDLLNRNNLSCWQMEADSLMAISNCVQLISETISFLYLVDSFNKNTLINQVESSVKIGLSEIRFSDIIISKKSRDLCRDIITSVISNKLYAPEPIDNISTKLGEQCKFFFSPKDMKLYRALEYLREAQNYRDSNTDPEKQRVLLERCLGLFVESGALLGEKRFRECVKVFEDFHWESGALNLCYRCAMFEDPENLGLEYYKIEVSKIDVSDLVQNQLLEYYKEKYVWRTFCYRLALEMIKPQNSPINKQLLSQALASNDVLFHLVIYDYLISENMDSVLIQIDTPYIVEYLRMGSPSIKKIDLLWRHFVHVSKFAEASTLLYDLAKGKIILGISLKDKIEYLSLAIANGKSAQLYQPNSLTSSFCKSMDDQFKTAQIQIEILHILKSRDDSSEEIDKLNSNLYNVSELYDHFALKFDMYEQILLLFKLANYQNRVQVFEVWVNLISKSLERPPFEDMTIGGDDLDIFSALSKVSKIGSRLYPSESSFPIDIVFSICVSFIIIDQLLTSDQLSKVSESKSVSVAKVLIDCGVPCKTMSDIICLFLESVCGITDDEFNYLFCKTPQITDHSLNTPIGVLSASIIFILSMKLKSSVVGEKLHELRETIVLGLLRELVSVCSCGLITLSTNTNETRETAGDENDDNDGYSVSYIYEVLSRYSGLARDLDNKKILFDIENLEVQVNSLLG